MTDASVARTTEQTTEPDPQRRPPAWRPASRSRVARTGSDSSPPCSTRVAPTTPASTGRRPRRPCAADLEGGLEVDALYLREDRAPRRARARCRSRADAPCATRRPRGTCASCTTTRTPPSPERPCSTTSSTASPRCGCTSATTAWPWPTCPRCSRDVRLDLAPVVVSSVTDQPAAARALLDLVGRPRVGRRQPRPRPVRRRGPARHRPADLAPLADLVRQCAQRDGWRAITIDARVLHEAGATDVDALAVAVATGVEYLRHLEAAGIPATEAFGADRPAGRRHRRPVPHRRDAARRAPGVGPGRRGLRRRRGPPRRAHPRRDEPADVHPRGPVGQRAAQHPGRLRRLASAGPTPSPCCPTTPCSACPSGSAGGWPATPRSCSPTSPTSAGSPTPAAAPGTSSRSPTRSADAVWARFQEVERAGGAVRGARRRAAPRLGRARRPPQRDREIVTRRRPLTGVSMFPRAGAAAPAAPGPTRAARRRPGPGPAPRLDGLRGAA